jgi:beta-glucosidase
MLKNIAVNEWGQNGIICTDGGAFTLLMTAHKYFKTYEEAAAACIKAGINMFLDNYKNSVKGALTQGLITEQDMDTVLRGRFRVALKLGLLDNSPKNPYTMIGVSDTIDPWTKPEIHQLARYITSRSVVLLKNENNTLPLDVSAIHSIAVIGPYADDVLMDWYGGELSYKVSLLQGIKNAVGEKVKVVFVKSNKIDSAYNAAKVCDVAIVCIGNHPTSNAGWEQSPVPSDGKEAIDRSAISLEQEDLAKIVRKANPRTIEVLMSSFPFAINWSQEYIPAIVHITHCSQELGNGVADVLFGKVNPAGRLVQTWHKSIDDLPPMLDYDIRHGRTYMYFKGTPLYPFGYGLSYTQFQYGNLRLSSKSISQTEGLSLSVDVKNIGKRDGDEVVQVYLKYPDGIQRLRGFKRIFIKSGETKTVTIPVDSESIGMWNVDKHAFIVPSGNYTALVGASSADIRVKEGFGVR